MPIFRTDPWNLSFLPKPDRIAYAADLGDSTYEAVSGAAIAAGTTAWARLRVGGGSNATTSAMLAFVGAAAPSSDAASVFIRGNDVYDVMLAAGDRLWVKRASTSDVPGSCEVWIVDRTP